MEEALVSLVALLVSQSCNIGLTPVVDPASTPPTPAHPTTTPCSCSA
ncbi:hypothetical protein [Streptomyces sp. NPDC054952]